MFLARRESEDDEKMIESLVRGCVQYSSRECAKESARELANLLRLNAQAVSDAEGGSYGTCLFPRE